MKKIFILVFIIFLQGLSAQESKTPSNSSSSGSGGKLGLGLTLLGPTGITGKYLMNDKLSIESSLGFGAFGNGRFHLHGVLLYNFYQINESLSLYGGGGAVLEERGGRGKGEGNGRGKGNVLHFFQNDRDNYENSLGIRAPVGISWKNADKKFELSAEVYLNIFLIGRDGVNAGLAFAGRYYF